MADRPEDARAGRAEVEAADAGTEYAPAGAAAVATTDAGDQDTVRRLPVAVLRIYLGVIFLVAAVPKLTGEVGFGSRLGGFVQNFALENAHAFYRPFLEGVVLPNAGLFAALVIVSELLVGLALLTGTATRLAAGLAIFLLLNYLFAKGMWFWAPASNDMAFLMIGLAVAWGAGGRVLGVDRILARRYPEVPIW